MYRQYDESFNLPKLEESILEFWDRNSVFAKSLQMRLGAPRYIFYEGPPTANGLPHIGHALARTIKDIICRYQSMKGFLVERKAGWDTHGLPVELGVDLPVVLFLDGQDRGLPAELAEVLDELSRPMGGDRQLGVEGPGDHEDLTFRCGRQHVLLSGPWDPNEAISGAGQGGPSRPSAGNRF